jgi:hypothetical protein
MAVWLWQEAFREKHMRSPMRNLLLGLLLGASAMAQTTFTRRIELQPSAWSASSSPEY